MVALHQRHAEFLVGGLRLISLAIQFDEFGVGQCSREIDLTFKAFQLLEILVGLQSFTEPVVIVEEEIAASYYTVQCTIHCLDIGVGRKNFPSPEVAVSIGKSIHSIYKVRLDIREQRKQSAVKRAALEVGIDSNHCLVRLIQGGDGIVLLYGIIRILVQT